jgi:phosphate transport system substrate-binding protein
MRDHLIRSLEHSHEIQVVAHRANADALLRGTGQIWSTGEVSLSPRSHSADEPVLEGYLSVEVIGKNDQTLWSYLATPGRFPWRGIEDNLARQVVSRLLDDIRKPSPQPEPSDLSASSTAVAVLKGAGATFPAPLYQKWLQSFEEIHPEVHITYEAVGSGEGIRRVSDGEVDFGASEMPLSDQALSGAHHPLIQIPMVLGAVVPIYNVPGLRQRIHFTSAILAGIYLGKIKKWNDPQIKAANPQAALPQTDIAVVHRSDSSGTSFVWSDYLSKVSAEWKSTVGAGVSVQWPVGTGAAYNEGVASAVQQGPNSIGYVELIYAIQHELRFAAVKNAAGEFIKADLASVTEAARGSAGSDRTSGRGPDQSAERGAEPSFRPSITDAGGKFAYPIATYTWLLLPEKIADQNKKAALLELVRWMLSSGQKSCSALGYAPLPAEVSSSALQSAERALNDESSRSAP